MGQVFRTSYATLRGPGLDSIGPGFLTYYLWLGFRGDLKQGSATSHLVYIDVSESHTANKSDEVKPGRRPLIAFYKSISKNQGEN